MPEILRYPNSVENVENGVIVRIKNFKPQFGGYLNLFRLEGATSEYTACLPLPLGHNVSDSFSYGTEEGGIAQVGAEIISNQREIDDAFEFSGNFMRALRARLGSEPDMGLAAVRRRARRSSANKREFKVFENVSQREFSFNFELVPTNKQESNTIHRIIYLIRRSSTPEVVGDGLQFRHPDYFQITIQDPNGDDADIIKMPMCVCQTISVTYNSDSISYFREDGMPVSTNLSLSFKEVDALNKNLIAEGF